jgi:hypothetical protein
MAQNEGYAACRTQSPKCIPEAIAFNEPSNRRVVCDKICHIILILHVLVTVESYCWTDYSPSAVLLNVSQCV